MVKKMRVTKILEVRWKIYDYFKSELCDSFMKKYFREGQCMTIGYMEYTEKNYNEIFSRLKDTLLNLKI